MQCKESSTHICSFTLFLTSVKKAHAIFKSKGPMTIISGLFVILGHVLKSLTHVILDTGQGAWDGTQRRKSCPGYTKPGRQLRRETTAAEA